MMRVCWTTSSLIFMCISCLYLLGGAGNIENATLAAILSIIPALLTIAWRP